MRLLATLFGPLSPADQVGVAERATEHHTTSAFLEALQMSHGDLANLLRTALRAAHPGERTYAWTRDVYDDNVVYELNQDDTSTLYQRSYTVADGAVTLGDPIAVIAVTQYVRADQGGVTMPATPAIPVTQMSAPASEAASELTGDLVPLLEKAVKADGSAKIKIIQAGQGASGYYPADVLKRDAGIFAEGTKIFLDHPSASDERDRPERSVKDLAGSLTGPAVWEESGAAGPGLYAPVKFVPTVAPHIDAIAPISGMSIRASGTVGVREIGGKKVRTIESLNVAHSVDVVTQAGAGGRVIDLIESARSGHRSPRTEERPAMGDKVLTLEEAQRKIDEMEGREAERITRDAQRDQELARLRETNVLREAQSIVVETLARIALPAPTRDRLTTQLSANPPLVEGTTDQIDRAAFVTRVNEAATAELDYLTRAVGSPGGVRGMGAVAPVAPTAPNLEESQKRIDAAVASLF